MAKEIEDLPGMYLEVWVILGCWKRDRKAAHPHPGALSCWRKYLDPTLVRYELRQICEPCRAYLELRRRGRTCGALTDFYYPIKPRLEICVNQYFNAGDFGGAWYIRQKHCGDWERATAAQVELIMRILKHPQEAVANHPLP